MNKLTNWIIVLLLSTMVISCTTDDVDDPDGGNGETPDLYEINDAAFGDYLIFNSKLASSEANALPANIAVIQDGKYYIDKNIAATATTVYLVKNATQVSKLEAAGVATAAQKIINIDGIQFFTATKDLKLTSNTIPGAMDLSALTSLEVLEMNFNYVNQLTLPTSIKRLRFGGNITEETPANSWLTTIDLTNCSALEHLYLKDQKITTEGLKLPNSYTNLKEIDLLNNPNAPFEIPDALFNQLTLRNGVISNVDPSYTGPEPKADYFEVPDLAFAEYLVYLTETATDNTKLPTGTALKYTDGKIYIHIPTSATATLLNISKANAFITKLTNAGVPTASVKISDADGLQLFTKITSFIATSNAFTAPLELENLTELTSLVVRTAGLSSLDISKNTKLTELDIQGSTSANLGRLKAADLSVNIKLKTINLSANEIVPADFKIPSAYTDMTTLNMDKNKVNGTAVTYTVPAALFNQLTSKDGLVSE